MLTIKNLIVSLVAFTLIATTLNSCKPDDHDHGQESITTLKVKLTPTGGAETTFTYKTLSGVTTKDSIKLTAGTVYAVSLELLDETKNPAENRTAEIMATKDEHQFFFTASPSGLITASNFDKDSKGKDVGLTSTWLAGAAQNGTLLISLKHLDENPKTGNINDGETDIEALFDVKIE